MKIKTAVRHWVSTKTARRVSNLEFSLPLRVYIEDTDAGGIVYYVNYLKFMERARTEFMRAQGYGKDYIFNHDLMFVVRDVAASYRVPARLDDELQVTASIVRLGGASMVFHQSVCRDGVVLAQGDITIACVDRAGVKPRRLPTDMVSRLRPLL
ncbi:MAG: tol-pal system-associated acyl-CoA thioesterase [Bacteroidia bacterium]